MKKGEKLQFCRYGHDVFVCGRSKSGRCKLCLLNKRKTSYQICKNGHDKDIVGRVSGNQCAECHKINNNKKYIPVLVDKRIHQFCPKGHDTFECGRDKTTKVCKDCAKIYQDKRHKDIKNGKRIRKNIKPFCIHGHEIAIVGRDIEGQCNQCVLIKNRIDPSKNSLLRQFCPKSHDTFITGRVKSGQCKICKKAYKLKRKKTNIQVKLAYLLRDRLNKAIKGQAKRGSAVRDLGCSIAFLKTYIESLFYGDMMWENHGSYWELDHIEAVSKFDLTDRKQFLKAVHYTNLQPLTIPDHQKKSALESFERSQVGKKYGK